MKLRISSSIFLFALASSAFAASQTPIESTFVTAPGKLYVGVFGGGSSSSKINASQYGTVFFPEFAGGPLAVNAFGQLHRESASFFGIQLGYKAKDILLDSSRQWTLGPAAELEEYSMNDSTFIGTLVNDTTRLAEGSFSVSYPMHRSVFLANAVVSFSNPNLPVHPYIGFGIGDAILRISSANALQTSPQELGINHYNASVNNSNSVFAGQIKLGLSVDLNKYVSLFADYRWLYLANSSFVFASTVNPTHAATTSWQVNLNNQRYNMGNLGIRVNF